jgi:RHS repeat-associated protein
MLRRLLWLVLALNLVLPSLCAAADQVYFYYTDPAGTPLVMTDANGAVVWKGDYKPFGEENSTTGTATNDRRFVGKEKDVETGLSYFGARYEDAKTGRFIAPDLVRAVDFKTSKTDEKLIRNPQRLNAYAYALNNPYKYLDSDGREPDFIALRCHVNPHFDRTENAIGGVLIGGALLGVGAIPSIPVLGSKLEYFLGGASGAAHNIQRSNQMKEQLGKIGFPNNGPTREFLAEHLTKVLNDSSNILKIQENGRVVRESLLAGPEGLIKFQTVWEGNKLITGTFFGGK